MAVLWRAISKGSGDIPSSMDELTMVAIDSSFCLARPLNGPAHLQGTGRGRSVAKCSGLGVCLYRHVITRTNGSKRGYSQTTRPEIGDPCETKWQTAHRISG